MRKIAYIAIIAGAICLSLAVISRVTLARIPIAFVGGAVVAPQTLLTLTIISFEIGIIFILLEILKTKQ